MNVVDVQARVTESRREQGLPPVVQDIASIDAAARIICEALDRTGRR